jgi:hypothetical protein
VLDLRQAQVDSLCDEPAWWPRPVRYAAAPRTSHRSPYPLDLVLPVVNLGQETAWNPLGLGQAIAYGLIVVGWILATALVAGITRVLIRS